MNRISSQIRRQRAAYPIRHLQRLMRSPLKILLASALGLILAAPLCATTLERDLGRGLVYMRVTQVPDDLPMRSQAPAIVLDLRYATGVDISEWLTTYAAPQTPIFVLANTATQKTLRQSIKNIAGSLTIGIASDDFTPDIALNITSEEEKRAYDALSLTADINPLLYPTTEKERYDEVSMIEEKKTVPQIVVTKPEGVVRTETDRTPLIDLAILRAVQIHRGWLALRSR